MICPKCAKENLEDAKFCSQCGTVLLPTECWSCGSTVEKDDKFCPHCGNNLHTRQLAGDLRGMIDPFMLIALILWGIAGVITGFAIHNKAYEGELFAYSIGATCVALGGVMCIKHDWLKRRKTLGLVLTGTGVFLFSHGAFCNVFSFTRRYRDWSDIALNFWFGLGISLIGLILFLSSVRQNRKADSSPIKSEDITIISTDTENSLIPENNLDRLYWNTAIDGMSFKFAWFVSYIGVWVGIVLNVLLLVFFRYIPEAAGLLALIILFQLISALGLYRFKRIAYLVLMVFSGLAMVGVLFSIIGLMIQDQHELTFGPVVGLFVQILHFYYFYKRRNVYAN